MAGASVSKGSKKGKECGGLGTGEEGKEGGGKGWGGQQSFACDGVVSLLDYTNSSPPYTVCKWVACFSCQLTWAGYMLSALPEMPLRLTRQDAISCSCITTTVGCGCTRCSISCSCTETRAACGCRRQHEWWCMTYTIQTCAPCDEPSAVYCCHETLHPWQP